MTPETMDAALRLANSELSKINWDGPPMGESLNFSEWIISKPLEVKVCTQQCAQFHDNVKGAARNLMRQHSDVFEASPEAHTHGTLKFQFIAYREMDLTTNQFVDDDYITIAARAFAKRKT